GKLSGAVVNYYKLNVNLGSVTKFHGRIPVCTRGIHDPNRFVRSLAVRSEFLLLEGQIAPTFKAIFPSLETVCYTRRLKVSLGFLGVVRNKIKGPLLTVLVIVGTRRTKNLSPVN